MKRLVVCCDGTWSRLDQRKEGVPTATNVSKLALGVAQKDASGTQQVRYYQPGVGTRHFDRLRGGAFGLGLSRNVRECYRFVVESYEPGDELYLFGFSRGAYTARSLAGLIRNAGILRPENAARIDDAYALYRDRDREEFHPDGDGSRVFRRMHSHPAAEIKLIGVWDTVGSLGIPTGSLRLPFAARLWEFHDTDLSSRVRFAYQALAIDEKRGPFVPTLWCQQDDATDQTLEQVWFPGVHSDVGGGYREPELADISLVWMVGRASSVGLTFDPAHFQPGTLPAEDRATGSLVNPDSAGAIHDSRRGMYRLLPPAERQLVADNGAISPSAYERQDAGVDYDPPNLI